MKNKLTDKERAVLRKIGAIGGKAKVPKGFAMLTPKQKSAMGKKAAKARAALRKPK